MKRNHPEVSLETFKTWTYWTYTKGFHAAFVLIDACKTTIGKKNELQLLRDFNAATAKDALWKKPLTGKHIVVITEVFTCSAFASIYIDANEPGYFFIGFKPQDDQWTVQAPKGTYVPSTFPYDHTQRHQLFPLYSMRAFHKAQLPVAELGSEPLPEVSRRVKEPDIKDNPVFDDTDSFWDSFQPRPDDSGDGGGGGKSLGPPALPCSPGGDSPSADRVSAPQTQTSTEHQQKSRTGPSPSVRMSIRNNAQCSAFISIDGSEDRQEVIPAVSHHISMPIPLSEMDNRNGADSDRPFAVMRLSCGNTS